MCLGNLTNNNKKEKKKEDTEVSHRCRQGGMNLLSTQRDRARGGCMLPDVFVRMTLVKGYDIATSDLMEQSEALSRFLVFVVVVVVVFVVVVYLCL